MGMVDATTSTDGCCIILGSKKLCYDVNCTNIIFKVHDCNVDFQHKEENPLIYYESSKWPLIASLLGCDCVQRMPRVGIAILFNKKLPKLVTWDAEEVMITHNNNLKQKMSMNDMNKVSKSIELFLYAPMLSLNDKLIRLSGDVLINGWGVNIGFNMNPCDMLPIAAESCRKANLFKGN